MPDDETLVLKSKDKPLSSVNVNPNRPPFEQFKWFASSWDIAKLWGQIDAGQLSEENGGLQKLEFNREFIESYAQRILGLKSTDQTTDNFSMIMHVDVKHARALPADALKEPLMLIHAGKKGVGMLQMDASTDLATFWPMATTAWPGLTSMACNRCQLC